jgi:hypothetical protein
MPEDTEAEKLSNSIGVLTLAVNRLAGAIEQLIERVDFLDGKPKNPKQ